MQRCLIMNQPRQSMSLVTYNIHKGFGVGKLRFLLPEMRYALSRLNPDFQIWPDLPQFEYIAENDWPHYLYAKNAVYQSGHHGNAILSKYPFVGFENINLARQNRASRSILHGQVKLDNGQILHLLCVHLGLFKAERASQYRAMIKRITDVIPEHEPLLMAGDFNDWRIHLSQPLAQELGIQEAFQSLEGQHARSFPALKPALCIDRIYFRGLKAESAQCFSGKPWRTLSDHLPLFAKFSLL
jgi:endonuclease/exonuclease/phosphatase family metal-dependent hydrolase